MATGSSVYCYCCYYNDIRRHSSNPGGPTNYRFACSWKANDLCCIWSDVPISFHPLNSIKNSRCISRTIETVPTTILHRHMEKPGVDQIRHQQGLGQSCSNGTNSTIHLPPIGVFWDIENCQVPKGKSALATAQLIRKKFFDGHREAEFMCVCDVNKENRDVIQELNNAQVTVVHINAIGKNAADDKLRQNMRRFADIHGSPSTIILISGDVNFAADLSDFNHRRHIRIVVLHNKYAPEPLLACAHLFYNFNRLLEEIPFRTPVKTVGMQQNCQLLVTKLPSDHTTSQIRSRLKQLSDNCGGRVISVSQSTAIIRFPTPEATQRARKRMSKEDVFGSKISVNFPTRHDMQDNMDTAVKNLSLHLSENGSMSSPVAFSSKEASFSPHRPQRTVFPPPPTTTPLDPIHNFHNYTEMNRERSTILNTSQAVKPVSIFSAPEIVHFPSNFASISNRENCLLVNYPHWQSPLLTEQDGTFDLSNVRNGSFLSEGRAVVVPSQCLVGSPLKSSKSNDTAMDVCSENFSTRRPSHESNCGIINDTITVSMKSSVRSSRHRVKSAGQANIRANNASPYMRSNASSISIVRDGNSRRTRNSLTCRSVPNSTCTDFPIFNQRLSTSPLETDEVFQPIDDSGCNVSSPELIETESVDLLVTNLDQTIDAAELRNLLLVIFQQHVAVLRINVILSTESNLTAVVSVPSMQQAQYAISQLHRRKIGYKRIVISLLSNSGTAMHILKYEVQMLLMDVPCHTLPLFKFRELFEKRYHQSISLSELNKMKDLVKIQDDSTGRMVSLNLNYRETPSPATSDGSKEVQEIMDKSFCEIHCPNPHTGKGWAEKESSKILPDVCIPLKIFTPQLHKLLKSHNGNMPLGSFTACYEHEFGRLEPSSNGVPLEHLIASVAGVVIVSGASGCKRIQWGEDENRSGSAEPRTISPPLAAQLALFSREVVDLLKSSTKCLVSFAKFIPAYHHHFGRQCRVADYGYTKLIDLLDAIGHVIQIIGEGNKRLLTLTHRSQLKRFTSDVLRILRSQASKQMTLEEFNHLYAKCFGKQLNVNNYGVCDLDDLLDELPDTIILVTNMASGKTLSIPKRDQTQAEIERTQQFSCEVVELLRLSPQCRMSFNKFIPAYHHHFDYQCRVSDYGFTKLIELFEAIPHVVKITGEGEEKELNLQEHELLKVLTDQIVSLVKSTKDLALPLRQLSSMFIEHYGHGINLEDLQVSNEIDFLNKIRHAVKITNFIGDPIVKLVDKSERRQMCLNARRILMEQMTGKVPVARFEEQYEQRFFHSCNIILLKEDLKDFLTIDGFDSAAIVQLVPLQIFARNTHVLLHDFNGQIPLKKFKDSYLERFRESFVPMDYGFRTLNSLFQSISDIAHVRGKGQKRILHLNREFFAGSPLHMLSTKLPTICQRIFPDDLSCDYQSSSADSALSDNDEDNHVSSNRIGEPIRASLLASSPLQIDKDLISFESPLPLTDVVNTGPMVSPSKVHDVPTQDSLVTDFRRTLTVRSPDALGASIDAFVPRLDLQLKMTNQNPTLLPQPLHLLPDISTQNGKLNQLNCGKVVLEPTSSKSCENLAIISDCRFTTANEVCTASSHSTPTHQIPNKNRVRSRIAANFCLPFMPQQ